MPPDTVDPRPVAADGEVCSSFNAATGILEIGDGYEYEPLLTVHLAPPLAVMAQADREVREMLAALAWAAWINGRKSGEKAGAAAGVHRFRVALRALLGAAGQHELEALARTLHGQED